jgi:FixJ family two-component response regulator
MPEIGVLLDVSSKTIDNRRKKIMASLQYQTPIDIVKMMVRFEERGFEI